MTDIRSVNDIIEEIKFDIMRRNPAISFWGPMSVVRTISEAFAMQIHEMESEIESTVDDLFLDTAEGDALDRLIVDRLPKGRLPGTKASGIVVFSRSSPAGSDITIPSGTRVAAIHANAETLYFVTASDAVLPAGETSTTASVIAEEIGTSGNVVSYAINTIISSVPGIEKVENLFQLDGGSDEESDDDLRKRYKYTVDIPGRATKNMIEQHLYDLDSVLEAKSFSVSPGEMELVIDCVGDFDYDSEVPSTIEDNIALGVVARGTLGALLNPDTSYYELGDCAGGYIWIRPEQFIPSQETITITYEDVLGDTRYTSVTIPKNTPKGYAIKAELGGEQLAVRIVDTSSVNYSYSVLIGLGEYPYLFNLPETVLITVSVSIHETTTPENNLTTNIENSITAFLNSFRIGDDLEFSDLAKYVFIDYSSGRTFTGVDTVNSITITDGISTISTYGEVIDIENDQRIRSGTVTVSVI